MSMLYFSRMRIAMNLLPLLRGSNRSAHVISVFGAGLEKPKSWNPENLHLRGNGHYNMDRCRTHSIMMKTMFMEHLSEENVGKVAFTHFFPGLVRTPAFVDESHPWWFKVMWRVLGPIACSLFATPPSEIGERVFFLASPSFPPKNSTDATAHREGNGLEIAASTYGVPGGGAYSCGRLSTINDVREIYTSCRQQKLDQKVVDHTLQVFDDIEKVGVYQCRTSE